MQFSKTLIALAVVAASVSAHADSDVNTVNAVGQSAIAHLNYRVTVPRVIFLQLGSGTFMADGGVTDNVDWTLTALNMGTGALAATTGAVSARILGNGGDVSLSANGVSGGPSNGAQAIPWTAFSAVATGGLTHPAIGNGAAGAATVFTAASNIVNLTGTWTFSYANAAPIASGNYAGAVTYTAALP